MSQTETAKFHGRCKALFIGSSPLLRRELMPFLTRRVPLLTASDLPGYPSPQNLRGEIRSAAPDLCILEVGKPAEPALELLQELASQDSKLAILAILTNTDPNLILRCLRLGATDFLLTPFTDEHVDAALRKVIKLLPQNAGGPQPGKIYCVMPVKGACGATTVACNLVYQWKRLGAGKVLLADLDPLTGTVAFLLKVKSNYNFVDVLQRASDFDTDLWKSAVANRNGVDVLLSPDAIDGASELVDPSPILEYARRSYDVVVVDAAGVYGEWNLAQARLSDEVLLVITNELPALQAARRALQYLEAHGVERWKIRLILNRYDSQVGLKQDVIASALGVEIYHSVPSDYDPIQKAMLEGKPVPPSTRFGKSIHHLADRLAGREDSARRNSSSLAGLLSLFSRTSA